MTISKVASKAVFFIFLCATFAATAEQARGERTAERTPEKMPQQDKLMLEPITQAEMLRWFDQREERYNTYYDQLKSLDDQELAKLLWQEERANYYRGLERMAFHAPVYNIEYRSNELNRLQDYADADAMLNAYIDSLTARQNDFEPRCSAHGSKRALQLDSGFQWPFRYQLHYDKASLADGSAVPFVDESNPARTHNSVIKSGDIYCLSSRDQQPLAPQSVSVNFRAQIPDAIVEFEFSAQDQGKTLTKQGYTVTVQSWRDNRFEIYIDSPTGDARQRFRSHDVLAEAQNELGLHLTWHSSQRRPLAEVPVVDDVVRELIQRALAEDISAAEARAELQALQRQFNQQQGNRLYLARAFNGDVDTARVTLMVYNDSNPVIERKVQLPVQRLVNEVAEDADIEQALTAVEVTAPVYDKRLSVNAEQADLSETALQKQVKLNLFTVFDQSALRADDYPNQVSWFYPPLRSDLLLHRHQRVIKTSASMLLFLDEQEQPMVDPAFKDFYADPKADIHYASALKVGGIEAPFMAARLEFDPKLWPRPPARVTGKISLVSAPNMQQVQYPIDDLPAGLSFTDNRLTVDLTVFDVPQPESIKKDPALAADYQLMAKDEHGYLAVWHKQPVFLPNKRRPRYHTYYFYGQPEHIEIWYPGKLGIVDLPVELEL
ncbi:hypothetical protein [Idiomarina xiamenensis]|uniref:Uncharacterized protein n=1 Tax=Idiomarina xiamenensis 10-D-4 TaxID=740709 RepID=K2K6Y7_9GAMM|nr:hypothetical protein [Idiomarina xiamenensis]EKE83438.1 hypothetical protein A10D4_08452 [Idiomarina xiamenensis 10-D-4]